MVNRIFVTGPVGSGKSTLARRLARDYGFISCELDRIVYEPDPNHHGNNRKRSEAERDALFQAAMAQRRWIMEDAGRGVFESAWQAADSVILLEPPKAVRRYRIVSRWIKQNLGIERCDYKPDFTMLKLMFKWTRDYERGGTGARRLLMDYQHKTCVVRNERDLQAYIDAHLR